jgi:Ca2+-binding RTX toxin-like protein
LFGGGGGDTLIGGAGNDALIGGGGNDRFVFNATLNAATNLDTVNDFVTAADTIWLDTAIFTALANNTLGARINANQFVSGAGINAATTLDQRLIYNTTSGALYYDADGSDVGVAAIQIALIGATIHPTVVASDIFAY